MIDINILSDYTLIRSKDHGNLGKTIDDSIECRPFIWLVCPGRFHDFDELRWAIRWNQAQVRPFVLNRHMLDDGHWRR